MSFKTLITRWSTFHKPVVVARAGAVAKRIDVEEHLKRWSVSSFFFSIQNHVEETILMRGAQYRFTFFIAYDDNTESALCSR